MTERTTGVRLCHITGLISLLLILTVSSMALILLPYRTSEYSGDGTITDSGYWTRPRYRISFDDVILTQSDRHVYSLMGVPKDPLYFGLKVLRFTKNDKQITNDIQIMEQFEDVRNGLDIELTYKITDESGSTVVDQSMKVQEWELSTSVTDVQLYLGGYDVNLDRDQRYKLTLDIKAVDAGTTRVLVQPFLAGGGAELP